MGESEFSTAGYLQEVKEERRDSRKPWDDFNKAKLEVIVKNLDTFDRGLLLRSKQTGSCLNVRGKKIIDTVLYTMEFWDYIQPQL